MGAAAAAALLAIYDVQNLTYLDVVVGATYTTSI